MRECKPKNKSETRVYVKMVNEKEKTQKKLVVASNFHAIFIRAFFFFNLFTRSISSITGADDGDNHCHYYSEYDATVLSRISREKKNRVLLNFIPVFVVFVTFSTVWYDYTVFSLSPFYISSCIFRTENKKEANKKLFSFNSMLLRVSCFARIFWPLTLVSSFFFLQ